MWLEVYRAINECLPRDVDDERDVEDITQKNRINVKSITAKKYPDLGTWYTAVTAKESNKNTMILADREKGPTGAGYVFTLVCEHYRDGKNDSEKSVGFVLATLLHNLQQFEIAQPGTTQPIPVRKQGISHACIVAQKPFIQTEYYPRGKKGKSGTGATSATPRIGGIGRPLGVFNQPGVSTVRPGQAPSSTEVEAERKIINRTDFTIQFAWVPTPVDQRPAIDPLKPAETTTPADPSNLNVTLPPGAPADPNAATNTLAPVTTTPAPTQQ